MEQAEMTIFIILVSVILLIFIAGTIIFMFQFQQKKLKHNMEKASILEQHQRELLHAQLEIQRRTMQQIGSEIHDSVGQKLTLAFLYTSQLLQGRQLSEITERVDTIGNIITESLAELRQLSKTLNNPELAEADLITLLQNECRQVNAAGICYLSLESNVSTIAIPSPEKNILFRILQEFIQNSLKHAHCKRIFIQLDLQHGHLLVKASDDGKGFDTVVIPNGIGLGNMKRRAQQIGADFTLQSTPGNGTILTLYLPTEKWTIPLI
ncbi:sensor histidine kinase [Chitinophaga sp. RCC_12]|uniref:sensor histidine kinase n=1 Tax=Chitinophaga sp. RCC_12 TaxID=3239226 RepID=UPI0035244BA1